MSEIHVRNLHFIQYSSISGEVQSTGSVPMMGEVSSSHTPTSTIGDITGRTKSDG